MRLVPGELYHVYNRGNNHERIFYTDRHYQFFLGKMTCHVEPYAELLAYCLMPNHFHFLIRATEDSAAPYVPKGRSPAHPRPASPVAMNQFAHGLQIALSSYTRAFNKSHKRTGSLFTQNTRAKQTSGPAHGLDYSVWCFIYIHDFPVRAGFVQHPGEWPWSSYREYAGISSFQLCKTEVGRARFSLETNALENFNGIRIPHQIIDEIH